MAPRFDWDDAKNAHLKKERGLGFDDILVALEQGGFLDLVEHPDQERYGGQRILIVAYAGYAYLVPFVDDGARWFLKTVIPSRKATRRYETGGDE